MKATGPLCGVCFVDGGGVVRAEIPMRVGSAPNLREHWTRRHRRVAQQRHVVSLVLGKRVLGLVDLSPATVTLRRVGPRRLDDDNLQGALKAVRDQVAAALGVDDADPRVRWVYEQSKGPYRVDIRIEPSPAPGDG